MARQNESYIVKEMALKKRKKKELKLRLKIQIKL